MMNEKILSMATNNLVEQAAMQAKCAESEPVAEVSEEAFGRGQLLWFKEVPKDGTRLYTKPQPSDADDKLSESNIIEAIKDGYKLSYNEPVDYLTDEANLKAAWFVQRSKAPFSDKEGMGIWLGATPLEAINKCKLALKI